MLSSPTSELLDLARGVIWFEPPSDALADRVRFLAYLMTYGTAEDVTIARRHFSAEDFRDAIENAPPSILDERSWPTGISSPGAIRRRRCRAVACRTEQVYSVLIAVAFRTIRPARVRNWMRTGAASPPPTGAIHTSASLLSATESSLLPSMR